MLNDRLVRCPAYDANKVDAAKFEASKTGYVELVARCPERYPLIN